MKLCLCQPEDARGSMCPRFPFEFSNFLIDVTEILELIGCSLKKEKKIVQRNAFNLNVRAWQAWPVPFGLVFLAFLLIILIHLSSCRICLSGLSSLFFCGILSFSLFWLPFLLCNKYQAIVLIFSYPLFCPPVSSLHY